MSSNARTERIILDEVMFGFQIGSGIDASVIQFVSGQYVQKRYIVKIEIDHRTVMLRGGDQDRRPVSKQEIMRVLGMLADRLHEFSISVY